MTKITGDSTPGVQPTEEQLGELVDALAGTPIDHHYEIRARSEDFNIKTGPEAYNCPICHTGMHLVLAMAGPEDPPNVGVGKWKCYTCGHYWLEDGDVMWVDDDG